MADPFATAEDVAARWRTLTPDEIEIANQLAIDASNMIREQWPDVDERIAAGTLMAETLERIVANMVKRAMLAGDVEGLESRQQAAGPFSINDKFSNPNGNLYFTAAEIQTLNGRPPRRAFAVDLSSNTTPCGDYYYSPYYRR
jgi:hypothetical protein